MSGPKRWLAVAALAAGVIAAVPAHSADPAAPAPVVRTTIEPTPPTRKHLPSRLLLPDQYIPLNFDHKVHLEKAQLDCDFCHETAPESTKSSDRLVPGEDICLGCHVPGVEAEEGMPSGECASCHPGYEPQFPPGADTEDTSQALNPPPHVVIPTPFINMNHKVHTDAGVPCTTCHQQVPDVTIATRDNALPTMGTCLTCHDGKTAPMECKTCHQRTDAGTVRTDYPAGTLMPSGKYFGDTHDAAFFRDHAALASARGDYCANCHEKQFCTDCHMGNLRPNRVHPSNWILVHPTRARGNDLDCASCHRSQTFCVACHQRAGVVLDGPLDSFPSSSLRFHPEGWNNQVGTARSANHHGFQAQRNLRACASCHAEKDCVACHATLRLDGLGANPHPSNFLDTCKARKAANPTVCAHCHMPSDPLLGLCD